MTSEQLSRDLQCGLGRAAHSHLGDRSRCVGVLHTTDERASRAAAGADLPIRAGHTGLLELDLGRAQPLPERLAAFIEGSAGIMRRAGALFAVGAQAEP